MANVAFPVENEPLDTPTLKEVLKSGELFQVLVKVHYVQIKNQKLFNNNMHAITSSGGCKKENDAHKSKL